MGVISQSSKEEDVGVQVCTHVANCYAVASQFESCREKLQEIPQIVKDLCRILYFKVCLHRYVADLIIQGLY